MHKVKKCYVDSLPDCCIECIFMHVNNNAWDTKTKSYISTQYCVLGEHGLRPLPERWRTRRDPNCILKQLNNNEFEQLESNVNNGDIENDYHT